MSYRNPTMIPPADPMAFSRGFEQAFTQQQSAFQADLEERKKLAQEADEALANAYAMADIGPINGIDNKFNQALQDSLNKIIDDGDFANASKADQVKMLQDLRLKKAAFGRIGEIMSVDTEDWDLRNDPKLSAFRKAVLSGEDFKIDSSGLDFKVNGSFGTITLDDIANTRIINKAPYEEKLDQINGDFAKRYGTLITEAFKQGKSNEEIQLLKNKLKDSYASLIKDQDVDFKKYMQYNVAETDDENQMIENMFNQIDSATIDPDLFVSRPKPPQPDASLVFAGNLGMTAASSPASFFNRLSGSENYTDIKMTEDFNITFNRPIEVEDEKGNITIQQQAESLDLKDPGDLETYARALFNQYGGKDISMKDRNSAYLVFKQQLVSGLAQSYEARQAELKKQAEARARQPQIGPKKEYEQKSSSARDQILGIDTFKPNQEISVREKRNMISGVQKKILAELNDKKLPITYANYDRMVKYLGLDDQQSFSDVFLGRTKSDEDLLSVNI